MLNKPEIEYYEKYYCDNFDSIINSKKKNKIIDVYVDGSFNDKKNILAYAFSIYKNNTLIYTETGTNNISKICDFKSVGAELYSANKAFEFLNKYNIKEANLYFDYVGIRDFTLQRNNKITFAADYYDKFIKYNLDINFCKIDAHKDNEYHNEVDKIAKQSLHRKLI